MLFVTAVFTSLQPTAYAQTKASFNPPLAVLHCEQARGIVTPERAKLALWYTAEEMGVRASDLPRILVINGSKYSARIMDLPFDRGGVTDGDAGGVAIYGSESGRRVYYLWMVTENSDLWLARGMVNILARHTGQDQNAQGDHVRSVLRKLQATVSAKNLKE